jgi:hypothetical protein
MARFQIVVGNLGTVIDTAIHLHAIRSFNDYKTMSMMGKGRVGGESVTMYVDGEPDPHFTYEPLTNEADGA